MPPVATNTLGNLFGGGLLAISRDLELARRYGTMWFAIACFDTFALLPLEREFIWPAKWTLAKVLFLINRWFILLLQVLMQVLDAVPIPRAACRHLFWIGTATGIFTTFICYCILSIRVYALYDCNRKVLILLIVLAMLHLSLTTSSASRLRPINMPQFVAEAVKLEGCGTLGHAQLKMAQYLTLWGTFFFIDAAVLALTLYRSIKITRQIGKVPIIRALWRHGTMYYLITTVVHLVSVTLILQQVHPRLKALNAPASLVLMSLMASRLVLSLHSQSPITLTSGPRALSSSNQSQRPAPVQSLNSSRYGSNEIELKDQNV